MKKKGFTFMELIIVIAIFGILLAVITPAWSAYLQRSRFRTYNQKAKTVFNAAQIVITEMEFAERQFIARYNVGDISEQAAAASHIASPISGGDWFFYWNGSNGTISLADGTSIIDGDGNVNATGYLETQEPAIVDWSNNIGAAITRITTDEMCYKIWVRDYTVQSVVCAEDATSRFIGAHPVTIYELDADPPASYDDDIADDLTHSTIAEIDSSWFDLDNSNDGTLITAGDDDE